MIRLGLTGGIGCGKSFVAGVMAQCGIPVYDSDAAAKKLMSENPALQQDLALIIGKPVVVGGKLDKKVMADFIFSAKENAAKVNALVHPYVIADFDQWCNSKRENNFVGMESAILLECGLETNVDYVIAVTAPRSVCLERAMLRDNATARQIEERMDAQMDPDMKAKKANYVVVNGADMNECDIKKQITQIINSITIC